MKTVLHQLEKIIKQRQQEDPEKSYVAQLNKKGLDTILKKIGEEATEVVIAAKSDDKTAIIYESCDLLFHLMVLLSTSNISLSDIESEIERRFNLSGIEEKKSRKNK